MSTVSNSPVLLEDNYPTLIDHVMRNRLLLFYTRISLRNLQANVTLYERIKNVWSTKAIKIYLRQMCFDI